MVRRVNACELRAVEMAVFPDLEREGDCPPIPPADQLNNMFRAAAPLEGARGVPAGIAPAGKPKATYVVTLQPGTPERKAVADALRIPVQKEVGQPVVFNFNTKYTTNPAIYQFGDYVFVRAQATQPSGQPLDRSKFPKDLKDAADGGMYDGDQVTAILKRKGNGYEVVSEVIGPTDYVDANMIEAVDPAMYPAVRLADFARSAEYKDPEMLSAVLGFVDAIEDRGQRRAMLARFSADYTKLHGAMPAVLQALVSESLAR